VVVDAAQDGGVDRDRIAPGSRRQPPLIQVHESHLAGQFRESGSREAPPGGFCGGHVARISFDCHSRRAPTRATFRSSNPLNSSWSSTSGPPKCLASKCHWRFSPAPTRWSS